MDFTKVRLEISYDGTEFLGWQRQPKDAPTVQAHLENALQQLFRQKTNLVGAGRTDAGVHAEAQTAHFRKPENFEKYDIVRALNSKTPESISVTRAWLAPQDFHAQRSATSKTYVYRIHCGPALNPLKKRFSHYLPVAHIDLDRLNGMAQALVGMRDFKSMQTRGTAVKSTERFVQKACWVEESPGNYAFRITGEGFLKQMVRNLVGTMLDLYRFGEGAEKIEEILAARDRTRALTTAPPQGLTLESVHYPQALDKRCRKI